MLAPVAMIRFACATLIVAALAAACGTHDELPADRREPAPPDRAAAAASARPRIVVLGDSLTAGLGIAKEDAYPAVLQQRLNQEGWNYEVVNAGVSGDTSAGGLSRLDWALDGDVRVLIVALGGNDGLRGLPPDQLKHNLATIIERAQARGIRSCSPEWRRRRISAAITPWSSIRCIRRSRVSITFLSFHSCSPASPAARRSISATAFIPRETARE